MHSLCPAHLTPPTSCLDTSTHTQHRLDDLTRDQSGLPLPPDMFKQQSDAVGGGGGAAAGSQRFTTWFEPSQSGSCMVISGAWKANTAYLLTLNISNPQPPDNAATAPAPPELWLVPLTYKQVQQRSGRQAGAADSGQQQLIVRGSKQGTLCRLR